MRRRSIESIQRARALRRRPACRRPEAAGFTVLEILVVVAIVGLIAVLVIETMSAYLPRFRLRQSTSQAQQLIQKTRLEAIRRGVTTVVAPDFNDRSLTAFAELNGDPNNPLAPGARYLFFDPDPLARPDRTDYLIGVVRLPGPGDVGVQFGGPQFGVNGMDAVTGLTPVPGAVPGAPSVVVFHPTGAVDAPGSLRFTDGAGRNYLEAAITNLTGKSEVRKYLQAGDSPTGTADFFTEANISFGPDSVGKNIWVWY